MSKAQSENSVRVVDDDELTAPSMPDADQRDEFEGSLLDNDALGDENSLDANSDGSDVILDENQDVNGDGTRADTPPASPSASQPPAMARTPKLKDGKPFCGHHKSPKDPHCEGLCEGCKILHGIELCTLENRCEYCVDLPK